MSRTEIREKIKQGFLDDALTAAKKQYEDNPAALWASTDLAWVYDAKCKRSAGEGAMREFIDSFHALLNLNVLPADAMLYETLCWRWRSLIAKKTAGMDEATKTAFMQETWSSLKNMPHPHTSEACSVLCKIVYHERANWSEFVDFMEWWGWDTFRNEDYSCDKMSNGKLMPISLVEGCHIACAKIILQTGDKLRYADYINRLVALAETHPEMIYLGYYTAKLLLATGGNREEMLAAVLPFVRKKVNEFWAWQILAEVERGDEMLYLACLLRAANCKTKDSFLIKIHYQLAYELIARHDYTGAKLFLQKYIHSKEETQSRLPADVCHWISEPWYISSNVGQTASPYLSMDYLEITNQLLYADIVELPMCVTHIDAKSRRAFVIYGYQQRGSFKLPRNLRNVGADSLLLTRLDSSKCRDGRLSIFTTRVTSWRDLPASQFHKRVEGEVTTNAKQTAYFVRHKKEFAYIPPKLREELPLKSGDKVCAIIILDYQKAKESWSWRCVQLALLT